MGLLRGLTFLLVATPAIALARATPSVSGLILPSLLRISKESLVPVFVAITVAVAIVFAIPISIGIAILWSLDVDWLLSWRASGNLAES